MTDININNPHHYYAHSVVNWVVDDDLLKCLRRLRREDKRSGFDVKEAWVWFIPHPTEAEYAIEFYAPQIEGAVCIAHIRY